MQHNDPPATLHVQNRCVAVRPISTFSIHYKTQVIQQRVAVTTTIPMLTTSTAITTSIIRTPTGHSTINSNTSHPASRSNMSTTCRSRAPTHVQTISSLTNRKIRKKRSASKKTARFHRSERKCARLCGGARETRSCLFFILYIRTRNIDR